MSKRAQPLLSSDDEENTITTKIQAAQTLFIASKDFHYYNLMKTEEIKNGGLKAEIIEKTEV